ncbi:hypothetical protein [Vulgatibacter sp.]|uniref:hypothetical protein n=1 Tax=Vulgatibacter sp. TaxID=1971226 RepID=UPI00356417C8
MSDLLESIAADRGRIADLVADGRLDQAAYRSRHLADRNAADARCATDAALVEWLRDSDLPRDRPAAWRDAFREGNVRGKEGSAPILAAVRRYLARGLVKASDAAEGRGGFLEGEPVGVYLLEAGLVDEAAASLFASLARAPTSGRAALLLGNALRRLERVEEARDAFRRALRVAPFEILLAEIEDEEVRGLADLGDELELPGDVRAWVPVIGFLEDVLPLSALDPVPGAGFGDATRVYDLLIAHKGARSHGERTAIRRDLKQLVPQLFDALLAARKLDAVPTPTGNA